MKIRPGLALLGLMLAVAFILLRHTAGNMLATDDRTESQNIDRFAGSLSIILFFLLIVIAQLGRLRQDDGNNPETQKVNCRAWIAGFVGTFMIITGVIIYVDPRGLYETNVFEPRLLSIRHDKVKAYVQLDETPDVVVMGSSRAFTVLPEFFEQDFGYSAFNMAVEAGRMEDYVIQTKFILDRDPQNPPKVLLIEITPPLAVNASGVAKRSPFELFPYMDGELQKLAIQTRVEGLLDLQEFNEAIYSLRYFASHPAFIDGWTFGPDGGGSHPTRPNFLAVIRSEVRTGKSPRCRAAKLNQEGTRRLEQVVELAEEHHMSVIFYTTPRHPDYYDQLMAGKAGYLRCQTAIQTYMDDLSSRYPFVFFLNYPRLVDIGGVADDTGYYDFEHMTPLNSHYLLQAAADTIRQAYTLAIQQRAQS